MRTADRRRGSPARHEPPAGEKESRQAPHRSADDIKACRRTVYHPQVLAQVLAGMLHAPARFACTVAAVSLLGAPAWAQAPDRHQLERIEQTLRREGQEIVALADAASGGGEVAADFGL